MKNETYPFMGVQVGSCVFAAPGKFNPTVIDGKITTTILQEAEWRSIRGQSNFVYTKEMNQGSFGVSGSHGLSGLSKINWSLSAYLGKAAAESSKSVKVNFEVMACGGVEHVDFANLTPSLLMAGMKRGPQQDLTKALNAYLDLSKFLKDKGKDLFDALTWAAPKDAKSQEYKDHKKFHDLFQAWMTSVSSFKLAYGEGMVVAAAWGGIGIVSVELTHKDRDNNWKYGGEAQFSYANAFHSVSLHALYDGSQSSGGADVKGAVEGFHVGSCVATQTEKWLAAVESSLLKGLDQTDIMAKAQEVKVGAAIKDPPPFVKPQEDKGIADKIKSIDGLDALKAYAKAAAYDEERKKKGNEKLTLEEFLQRAEEPADRRKLDDLHNAAVNSDVRTIPPSHPKKRVAAKAAAVKASAATRAKTVKQRAKAASAESSPFSGYVPLGLWISNWDHLFPWLATGWLNSIMDTQTASTVVRYRAMMQDFLALSRLYYIADNCHFELDVLRVEFRQIAESFGNACNVLQEATTEDEYEVKMQEAYHGS